MFRRLYPSDTVVLIAPASPAGRGGETGLRLAPNGVSETLVAPMPPAAAPPPGPVTTPAPRGAPEASGAPAAVAPGPSLVARPKRPVPHPGPDWPGGALGGMIVHMTIRPAFVAVALVGGQAAHELAAQDAFGLVPACLSSQELGSTPSPRPTGAAVLDAFARFDVTPVLQNRDEVARALEREYPSANRDAGVGGETYLWILIDDRGVARAGQVNISSGCRELDEAALRAAPVMRFSPAMNEGRSVAVWIPIAISFDPDAPSAESPASAEAPGADPLDEPSFTPFDVAPVLQNRGELATALRREYPPRLRDAEVGGRVTVWIRLDVQGVVQDVRINTSSAHPALDEAALNVARIMRFSPATDENGPVPAWISVPLIFEPRSGARVPERTPFDELDLRLPERSPPGGLPGDSPVRL